MQKFARCMRLLCFGGVFSMSMWSGRGAVGKGTQEETATKVRTIDSVIDLTSTSVDVPILLDSAQASEQNINLKVIRASVNLIGRGLMESPTRGQLAAGRMKVKKATREDLQTLYQKMPVAQSMEPLETALPRAELFANTQIKIVNVDLNSLYSTLELGREYNLVLDVETVTPAGGGISERRARVQREVRIHTRARIPVENGWLPGDGHVHTEWSDGARCISLTPPRFAGISIQDRVDTARTHGFQWLAISDHAQQIDGSFGDLIIAGVHIPTGRRGLAFGSAGSAFGGYCREIDDIARQPGNKMTLLKGLEYSTADPDPNHNADYVRHNAQGEYHDAHLLIYEAEPTHFLVDGPRKEDFFNNYTGAFLLQSLVPTPNLNTAAVIAHPYSAAYPWFHDPFPNNIVPNNMRAWDNIWEHLAPNSPTLGIELMSGGEFSVIPPVYPTLKPKEETIKLWDRKLREGYKIFGVANSDDHLGVMFGRYWTYVHIPEPQRPTPATVKAALREGRTIASTGPFLNMTCEVDGRSANIGDTLEAKLNRPIKITLTWKFWEKPENDRLHIRMKAGDGDGGSDEDAPIVWQPQLFDGLWIGTATVTLRSHTLSGNGYIRAWGQVAAPLNPLGPASVYTSPVYLRVM